MCVCTCMYGSLRGRKKMLNPLELELQLSQPTCVLGPNFSSRRSSTADLSPSSLLKSFLLLVSFRWFRFLMSLIIFGQILVTLGAPRMPPSAGFPQFLACGHQGSHPAFVRAESARLCLVQLTTLSLSGDSCQVSPSGPFDVSYKTGGI